MVGYILLSKPRGLLRCSIDLFYVQAVGYSHRTCYSKDLGGQQENCPENLRFKQIPQLVRLSGQFRTIVIKQ
jgi:hypothetical protein